MSAGNGGPAFPKSQWESEGMTLRDYFAAKAMQGIISTDRAQEFVNDDGDEVGRKDGDSGTLFIHTRFLVDEAYMIADAMLAAREEQA